MEYYHANGKLYTAETAVIGPNNRGLRFGDGLFETIKSINGKPEFIDEHFARLWKGLQVLQFNIPKHFTPDYLEQEIGALLKKNGHLGTARIRLTVYRGDGGLFDAIDHKPHYIIQSWALPPETGSWNSNGLVVGIYTDVTKNCDILSNLKHNNFLPYVLAALYAKKEKCNDAILLNNQGRLCDTSIANIFLVKDEQVFTPALSEGCVAGVMRAYLVQKMKAAGFTVTEGKLGVEDLQHADEVFLTNSMYNIRWVQSIGDKKLGNAFTQKIFNAFFSTNSK
jgi:branched-chain amino acid aminotransferase